MPKLSIIITSHNRLPLLKQAIDSVFDQTYKDFELIICDDDSTDPELRKYLEWLDENNEKVTVYFGKPVAPDMRKTHKMVSVMINQGMDIARGEFISLLCDDDVYLPSRCERMMAEFAKDETLDMVVDKVRWIGIDGGRRDQDSIRYVYNKPYEKGHDKLLRAIAPSTFICHNSVIFRRTLYRWPDEINHPTPVDWRFWCRLINDGYNIKKVFWVGEEALMPEFWRKGGTMDDALKAVGLAVKKEKKKEDEVKWARNYSKQKILVRGIQKVVPPNGRIEAEKVIYTNSQGVKCMIPGFAPDTFKIPKVKKEKKPVVEEKIPNIPVKTEFIPPPDIGSTIELKDAVEVKMPFIEDKPKSKRRRAVKDGH